MFTVATQATLVQTLEALSQEAIRLLSLKHLGRDLEYPTTEGLLSAVAGAKLDQMAGLLIELLSNNTNVRADARVKHTYDSRLEDLERHLRADGFRLENGSLQRLVPSAESLAQVSDHLDTLLGRNDLDGNGEIRQLLHDSRILASAARPDFNSATTKARIALEKIARRSASKLAARLGKAPVRDRWGSALSFLRSEGVITKQEEEALAKVYSLISTGAHDPIPSGPAEEHWALLAGTFAVAGASFLAQKYTMR